MEPAKQKFKIKILIKLAMVILVLGLGIYFSYFFAQKIDKLSRKVIESQSMIKNLQSLNEMKVKLHEDYNYLKPYLDKVSNFLPKEEKLVEIISWLESIASTTTVSQKLQIKEISSYKDDFKKADYKITLDGTYNNILNYLKEFEYSPYFVRMNNLSISSINDLEKNAKLISDITFFIKK